MQLTWLSPRVDMINMEVVRRSFVAGHSLGEYRPRRKYTTPNVWLCCRSGSPLFSFTYAGNDYCMALVWWYTLSDDSRQRDETTGMWPVERKYWNEQPHLAVVHVDAILHVVHLLPFFGQELAKLDVTLDNSLDRHGMFYVNQYVDHHSFEIL